MIREFLREIISWLGYLQRGSVLLQIALFVAVILLEKRYIHRRYAQLAPELKLLAAPVVLLIVSVISMAFGFPGGFLRYLSASWLAWRLVKPIKNILNKRVPKFPADELDKSIFRPIFLVLLLLSFFQMIGSREALSVIQIGTIFGVVLTIGKLFTAIVVIYAVFTLASRPAALLAWVSGKFFGISIQGRKALELILRYSMIGLGVFGVSYYIGINGTALVAVAGGLSVGIGFGLKEIISNFISSIWLLFEGTVRPGEVLMVNGDPCTVRKLGMRATQLRRGRDGAELLVPNQNFFTQEAESFTAEETSRRGGVDVGAAYHHEPQQVIDVLVDVAKSHERVLEYPPPAAFTTQFADSSINYKVLFWVRNPLDAFAVESDLRQMIWVAFEEHGIGIPFPQQQVYPMEWPPSKNQTLRIGSAERSLQADVADDESTGETL